MEALSKAPHTIEDAIALVTKQAALTFCCKPTVYTTRIKQADPIAAKPESAAQALEWLFHNRPQVRGADGTMTTDPVWGTAGNALIGAGVGAGIGGLSTLFSKKRKNWMRNALLGALMGGAGVGGLSAIGYGANALGQETETGLNTRKGAKPALPERLQSAKTHLQDGDYSSGIGLLDTGGKVLSDVAPRPFQALVPATAAGGVATGAQAIRQHMFGNDLAKHEAEVTRLQAMSPQERIQGMDDTGWQDVFGKKWQDFKSRITQATPTGNKNPSSMADAFKPTSAVSDVGPVIPVHEQIDQPTYSKLKSRAMVEPTAPRKPMSSRRMGALVGTGVWGALQAAAGSQYDPFQPKPLKPAE